MVPMALESAQPVLFPFGSLPADETECITFFFKADWSMHLLDQRLRSHSFLVITRTHQEAMPNQKLCGMSR